MFRAGRKDSTECSMIKKAFAEVLAVIPISIPLKVKVFIE
jgi:hypothetical protein